MYELAKLAGFFISPLSLALLAGGLALVCAWRRHYRWATGLLAPALAGLWFTATPAFAFALAGSLEMRYPAVTAEQSAGADAIVVLGGTMAPAQPPQRPNVNMGPAIDRVWHAAALFRLGKAPRVLVAAGNQYPRESQPAEAYDIAHVLGILGVPAGAIHLETHSRNTWENAGNLRPVLRQLGIRRVLLVTSAQHMPRAIATFQQAWRGTGVEILAASTDVEVLPLAPASAGQWLPDAAALALATRAIKEYAGLLALAMMQDK